MIKVVNCDTCGAPMKPMGGDVRRYYCEHCESEKQVAISEDQLAAGLRLDLTNVTAFVHGLAQQLQLAYPDRTRVLHEGGSIVLLELNIDPHMFIARREIQGGYTAQYKKLVRGVALKTKTLHLPDWVKQLIKSMAEHANQNMHVAAVIASLGGDKD
jgi:hypothetical protein